MICLKILVHTPVKLSICQTGIDGTVICLAATKRKQYYYNYNILYHDISFNLFNILHTSTNKQSDASNHSSRMQTPEQAGKAFHPSNPDLSRI